MINSSNSKHICNSSNGKRIGSNSKAKSSANQSCTAVCLARVRSNRESHVAVCLSALLVSHSVWRTQLGFYKNSTCLAESVFSPFSFHVGSFYKKWVFFTIKLDTWVVLTTKLHEWVVSTIIF